MYGLPADFDVGPFVGNSLEQVSFSANTVDLTFANDVAITVEAVLDYSSQGPPAHSEILRPPIRESKLMRLIGETIRSAQASIDGTLILTFANGDILSLYDDTQSYESYRIRLGEREIIV